MHGDTLSTSSTRLHDREDELQASADKLGKLLFEVSIRVTVTGPRDADVEARSRNLAIRGIEGNIGPHNGDTFHNDLHKDLKADFILANPHFNDSDWGGDRLREDVRWKYGTPP